VTLFMKHQRTPKYYGETIVAEIPHNYLERISKRFPRYVFAMGSRLRYHELEHVSEQII